MTVSSTVNREQYATDGVTVAFTIHFPFFNDTDVNAIFVSSGGVSTILAINTDFTVTGGSGSGGTLTCSVAPATGGILTIYRDIPFTQEDDYVEDDPLPADTLEGGFDRAAMRDQQLKDGQDRALTFPPTIDPTVSAELPSPSADTYLGWNSAGDALENKSLPSGTAVYSTVANTRAGTATGEAVTPDSLASLWQEGTALVSAASIAKPADAGLGGSYTQSGNTGTNTYWAGVVGGEAMWIRYTGTPAIGTSGNIVPPNNASYQVIAGDMIGYRWDASATKWRAFAGLRADGSPLRIAASLGTAGQVLTSTGASSAPTFQAGGQMRLLAYVFSSTYQTCSTVVPDDDTIPQITEGDQVMTSGAVTPGNVLSTILIEASLPVLNSTTVNAAASIHKTGTNDALASRQFGSNTSTFPKTVSFDVTEVAGSGARTYTVRVGPASGSAYINGDGSARKLGGAARATLKVWEILP